MTTANTKSYRWHLTFALWYTSHLSPGNPQLQHEFFTLLKSRFHCLICLGLILGNAFCHLLHSFNSWSAQSSHWNQHTGQPLPIFPNVHSIRSHIVSIRRTSSSLWFPPLCALSFYRHRLVLFSLQISVLHSSLTHITQHSLSPPHISSLYPFHSNNSL